MRVQKLYTVFILVCIFSVKIKFLKTRSKENFFLFLLFIIFVIINNIYIEYFYYQIKGVVHAKSVLTLVITSPLQNHFFVSVQSVFRKKELFPKIRLLLKKKYWKKNIGSKRCEHE